MKKYVFTWIDFSDNEMTSKIILSDLDAFEVAYREMTGRGWDFTDVNTIDDLKNSAFNSDCLFEIIEV